MTTDITRLLASLKRRSAHAKEFGHDVLLVKLEDLDALVEALEKAQSANAAQDDHINQQQDRIEQLEKGHQEAAKQITSWFRMAKQNIAEREKDIAELDAARQRIAELEYRTVNPEDTDGVREEDNKFLVVRHPGKVPVIKHPVGQLEDYLLQILQADPLATIDIVTHRYYGVGGQFVEDADEYLHEMGIKWEAE